jgi:hypothetical protein
MKMLFLSLLAATTLVAQVPKEHAPGQRPPPLEERVHDKAPRRPKLTEEQKKQRDAIVSKYDTNKDGKLDPEERKNVSEEDRKLLRSFGPPRPPGSPKPKKD